MPYTPKPIRKIRKTTRKLRNIAVAVALILAAASVITASIHNKNDKPTPTTPLPAKDLLIVQKPATTPGQDIQYTGFTVNFNPQKHLPNYVAWELTPQKAKGTLPRTNKFKPDNNIAGTPTLDDYRGSGFDRGHMAPAGDMKWDKQAMSDCFYLTNMSPQTSRLNSGRWNDLETLTRKTTAKDSTLIIVCGPILTDRLTRTIGPTKVVVPQRFFKVIYAPYSQQPYMLGFIFSNTQLPETLKDASYSIDQIEQITGLDFFSALPDDQENILESQNYFPIWQTKQQR